MDIKKITIKDNDTGKNKTKRLVAIITDVNDKEKTVYFGLHNSGGTFFDGATENKRENYNGRHSKMGEAWGKSGARSAGFYSRWVLWESRSKAAIKKKIKEITGAKTINMTGVSKITVTKPN